MLTYYTFFVLFCVQLACSWSQPLFLTPLIRRGRIDEARQRAEVKPFLPNVKSYSGYLTVNDNYDSNMFFWFFPKKSDWTTAPLVLWLQGGPGSSSLFGLFIENGPYVFKNGRLLERPHSWTNFFNVLYVDNPVGTGFSFTNSSKGYAVDQTMVGENLHEALGQFLLLFPQMQKNKLILSGESYAGKYLPALAHTILTTGSTKPKINVYGLFVGNPMINPEDMLTHYSTYLAAHGLLDTAGQRTLRAREELILRHIYAERWDEAGELFQNTFFEGSGKGITLFNELSGIFNHFDMRRDNLTMGSRHFVEFVNKNSTKAALHVRKDRFGANGNTVYQKLKPDIMKSMKPHIGTVLESYRMLVYSGQFDIICPHYLQVRVSGKLDWSGNWDYHRARRQPLRWRRQLCGYYKQAKLYTEVMIRNAGHFVPVDRPRWLLGLLRKFVDGGLDTATDSLDVSF